MHRGRVHCAPASAYPWDAIASVDAAFLADAAYITLNGSDVSAWAAQKGAFTLSQSTAADQPAWNATGCNGNGSVEGDGVSEHVICDALGAGASGDDTPFDLAILFKGNATGLAATQKLWMYGNSADVDSRMYLERGSSAGRYDVERRGDADVSTTAVNSAGTWDDTNWHVAYVSFAGTTVSMWMDGVLTINGAALNLQTCTLNRFTLFAARFNAGASLYGNFSASAVVRATANLSSTDRDSITNYLKTRGGIA